jgi:hypothetical protein
MNYIIRQYERNDEHKIVKLFEEVFGKSMTVEQWKWKYEGQGFTENNSAVAISENKDIVGHFGAITVRFRFRNEFTLAYQAVDHMIRRTFRGGMNRRGLYFHLGNFFYGNLKSFKYGFVNLNHLKLGKIVGLFEDCIEVYDYVTDTRKQFLPAFTLEPIDWNDPQIDILWENAHRELGWSVVRDRAFLQWRYQNNPFHAYKLFGIKKRFQKGLIGWIVEKDDSDKFVIMDMIVKGDHLENVLKKAISAAYKYEKRQVVLWMNNRYNKKFGSIGFQPSRRGTYIFNAVYGRKCESREMYENFYYTMGDTDFL